MRGRIVCGILFAGLAMGIAVIPQRAASRHSQDGAEDVPAYHNEAPKGPLPATMSPSLFGNIVVQNAYLISARIKKILYQQPCYCHCDRSQGHGSLLDCFASKHASGCDVCTREGFYAYEQSKKGKTAAQIREGIEQGEWRQVDMTKYQAPLAAN